MHASNRSVWLSSLLALSLLSGCASKAAPPSGAAAQGYDLRIDGDDVSLTLGRALTIPEFLGLAQQVTGARHVYEGHEVATGPVTLVGRIQCPRSAFPDFVRTMLYVHGLQADAGETGDGPCVEVRPITKS